MRDINYALRKFYYDKLNGNITYNSQNVPIFSKVVPQDGVIRQYYIILSNQLNTENGSKSDFNTESQVQVMIISKELNNNGGKANEDIGGQVLDLIYPKRASSDFLSDGSQITGIRVISDNIIDGLTDGVYKVVQRIIVFSQQIFQKISI